MIIHTLSVFSLILLYLKSPNDLSSFFLITTGFIITYLISIIGLYVFRRKYLKSNLEPINKNRRYVLFLISGTLPLIIDLIWDGRRFVGLEILVLGIILSCSSIYRSSAEFEYKSFKEKYLLSLSFNLSSTFLYLAFILVSFFGNNDYSNLKNLASSFLSIIPDLISRLLVLFPLLLIITIATTTFTKKEQAAQEYNDDEILDSNIFK